MTTAVNHICICHIFELKKMEKGKPRQIPKYKNEFNKKRKYDVEFGLKVMNSLRGREEEREGAGRI